MAQSTVDYANLKKIPQKFKDAVYGYLRKEQIDIPEIVNNTILLFYGLRIDSAILTISDVINFLELLEQNNVEIGDYYEKIYHAKIDGLSEPSFKNKCHDKENIVCFIQTKCGNIFGGYTSKGWKGKPTNSVAQSDTKAFIFSVTRPGIGFVSSDQTHHALQIFGGYYCIFGFNSCLHIQDETNQVTVSSRPINYDSIEWRKLCFGEDLQGINNSQEVKDIEVFQVS